MRHGRIVVEMVDAQVVRPLRHAVLRPGQPAECCIYPGDDDPLSAHGAVSLMQFGITRDPTVMVAVGSVMRCPAPWEPARLDSWRIRGMATRHDARGRGLGGLVLDALLDHVASHGGGLVWCNARVPAQGLYGRAGFSTRGQVFEVPEIGPHIQMFRTLTD